MSRILTATRAAVLVLVLGSAVLHAVAVIAVVLLAAAVWAAIGGRAAAIVLCVLLLAADVGLRVDAAPNAAPPTQTIVHHGH